MPDYPSLYQVNTRVWLTDLGRKLGRPATLDDVPDSELDQWASLGFDWVWLLSVWQTSPASRQVSLSHPDWQAEFRATLPDLKEEDIGGSGFAIRSYSVAESLGGDSALARFRLRMKQRGLKLMLDFVPNHVGLGHPWLVSHPEFFIPGTEEQLAASPQNYTRVRTPTGEVILAYGRDPYFPGWPDALQLNYGNSALQQAMTRELAGIARMCDGVRCDMAMLLLPDVFASTWGVSAQPFWPAAINQTKRENPDFRFLAEVYWDREWELQQVGFDYTYDKRLYDRLREGDPAVVRTHYVAGLDFQDKLARFLENHDESRAASAFPLEKHRAAAVATYTTPGMRLFHQGQFEGKTKRISPHLIRGPAEQTNEQIQAFYARLLPMLRHPTIRHGQWQLLECMPAWEGNPTANQLLAWLWTSNTSPNLLAAINYGPTQGQTRIPLPLNSLANRTWRLRDLLSPAEYGRDGNELRQPGLYLDIGPWNYHVFELLPT